MIIFFGSLAIAAAAIVWFSLLIRKALLLVAIVLGSHRALRRRMGCDPRLVRKRVGFVVALIVSKLVITVVFLVAITQVDAPIDFDLASLSDPIAGIVLMAIAGFAPYMTYKFVSFLGFDLYQPMSAEQEAKQALNRPVPLPSAPKAQTPNSVLYGYSSPSSNSPTPPSTPHPASDGATGGATVGGGGATGSAAALGRRREGPRHRAPRGAGPRQAGQRQEALPLRAPPRPSSSAHRSSKVPRRQDRKQVPRSARLRPNILVPHRNPPHPRHPHRPLPRPGTPPPPAPQPGAAPADAPAPPPTNSSPPPATPPPSPPAQKQQGERS